MNHAAFSQRDVTERFTQAKLRTGGCGFSSLASLKWVLLSLKECNYTYVTMLESVSQQGAHKYLHALREA